MYYIFDKVLSMIFLYNLESLIKHICLEIVCLCGARAFQVKSESIFSRNFFYQSVILEP